MTATTQVRNPNPAIATGTTMPPPGPDVVTVTGGSRLNGEVTVGGSVDAAEILLAAAVVQSHTITLSRVPTSPRIEKMISLLAKIGWPIARGPGGAVTVPRVSSEPTDPAARGLGDLFEDVNRDPGSTIYLIPALLWRFGCAAMPWIAAPIDEVLDVYRYFGDKVETSDPAGFSIIAGTVGPERLEIPMRSRDVVPTVTAVLRAFVTGTRIGISSPSRAGAVRALFTSLLRLGWYGSFSDERLDLSPGTTSLRAIKWEVPGDELEAVACVCALVATRGKGSVSGLSTKDLKVLRMLLAQAGVPVELSGDRVTLGRAWRIPGTAWTGITAHGGLEPRMLPSDQVPLLLASVPSMSGRHRLTDSCAIARTASVIDQLKAFGTPVEAGGNPGRAVVTGPSNLIAPAHVLEADDPIGAIALVIAALTATGTTTITLTGGPLRSAHPTLFASLRDLGAKIKGGDQ